MTDLVSLTDVTKVYQGGITGALNGISVTVEKGEFTAIMGPSGSGKSTMLNLVAGLDKPSSGTVVVGGTDLGKLGEAGLARFRRDHIGFVFQFFHLLPNLTALENVLIPAQLKGYTATVRGRELLEELGIKDVADSYPARMSGGQQQRVAIARALINNPTLLLADEPTGALDTRTGDQVMELLGQLHRNGQTILLVTHDAKLATRHAARVISVMDGKIVDDARLESPERAPSDVIRVRGVLTATMTLSLMSQARDPYQAAFDAQKGAHLQVTFDSRIDPATLAGTPGLIGAAAFGGPYPATDMQFRAGGHKYLVTTIGRDNPNGEVEQLRVTAGRWPVANNEIALTRSFADLNHVSVGDRLTVLSVPEQPVLNVTALVADIDEARADVGGQQHSWVLTTAIGPLTLKGSSSYRMNYRFASDPTAAQLQARTQKLHASLPAGSVTDSVNYLFISSIFHVSTQVLTSVLMAFSVFALAATAAIVANLVTGIVISGYREIGIMKAGGQQLAGAGPCLPGDVLPGH
ncbi:MAG: ABC transporter ATP-binding protein [Chloroflexi bacterium]|nr:MAG: ABC transporter ATP-binding protein [Chloroflexota bacterium]